MKERFVHRKCLISKCESCSSRLILDMAVTITAGSLARTSCLIFGSKPVSRLFRAIVSIRSVCSCFSFIVWSLVTKVKGDSFGSYLIICSSRISENQQSYLVLGSCHALCCSTRAYTSILENRITAIFRFNWEYFGNFMWFH